MYQAEADAARSAGMDVLLIDFEALVHDDNVERALRSIPKSSSLATTAVYRGWMMTPEQYLVFYRGLSERGLSLINPPQEYKHCHYLPEWLSELRIITPESAVLPMKPGETLTRGQAARSLSSFGTRAVIVKDFVKSEKHHWVGACYISDASDTEGALKVAQRFLERRGGDLQGGLVFPVYVVPERWYPSQEQATVNRGVSCVYARRKSNDDHELLG